MLGRNTHPANAERIQDGGREVVLSKRLAKGRVLEQFDRVAQSHVTVLLAAYPARLRVVHDNAKRMLDRIGDCRCLAVIEGLTGWTDNELLEQRFPGVAERFHLDKPGLPQLG